MAPAAANLIRGHIDVLTSVKGFKCDIVEDDVTYKGIALKRFTALCNLERGTGNPTLNLVNSVADALGLELRLGVRDMEAT